MVAVDVDDQDDQEDSIQQQKDKHREERRRTGRYIAAGTFIFISLLGLYEAIRQGSREIAAVFLTAILIFGYLLWLLWASRRKSPDLDDDIMDSKEKIEVVIADERNTEELPQNNKLSNKKADHNTFVHKELISADLRKSNENLLLKENITKLPANLVKSADDFTKTITNEVERSATRIVNKSVCRTFNRTYSIA